MRIAFVAHGIRESELSRVEFYRQDLESIRALGHDVYWTPDALRLRRSTDLIFCWWWTYAWRAVLSGAIHRIPVVVTGVFDIASYPARPWYERLLMAAGARRASANIFVSEFERSGVTELLSLRRADLSPLVVDSSVYRPRQRDETRPRPPFLVANVAWKREANMRRKMLPELVAAMRFVVEALPEARLVLAGPPEDGERHLRELVAQLKLERCVEFRGELTLDEKIDLYQTCDVYVQCSRYEGFGLAIAEAMACGAPVVVTPVPPVTEVVGDCGVYVEPATPSTIAAAILRVARDPNLRSDLAERGARRVAELFTATRRRRDLQEILGRFGNTASSATTAGR